MIKKHAIFYLTYDGYYNYTSGIGTQTKTFINGVMAYKQSSENKLGSFSLNLVVPIYDQTVFGYDHQNILSVNNVIANLDGKVFISESSPDKHNSDFWTVKNWERVCRSTAEIILAEAENYESTIVFAIDPPFLLTPRYIEENNRNNLDIKSVICMYTSTYIHDEIIDQDRLKWEQRGFQTPMEFESTKIANVCDFMTNHVKSFYNVCDSSLVPYQSSLFLGDGDFNVRAKDHVVAVLKSYNIPQNVNIVFSFGRASWVKGFDTLLEAFGGTNISAHLVLVASEFIEDQCEYYFELIRKHNLSCTFITEFSRELAICLSQYEKCKVVVCPSRREPFSNIPLEVALWAENSGAVILASNIGGFTQQVDEAKNGFLFEAEDSLDLASKIKKILQLSDQETKSMRDYAYEKVVRERDFQRNFSDLLEALGV